ncbi:MAG: DHA2 family efflux MFS transporter permease subunit, partial [Alphaproteobacteria bacterium]
SLAQIRASLSADADEIPWVQTSYLIAKVISVPLSGFLLRTFSTRYTFVAAAAGFTLMSVMCATATTINEMILWRALQGFVGGPMVPAVFATAFTLFPPSKNHIVGPAIALVATLGLTAGPAIGGYLTELYSWHWIFLVNVVPGLFVAISGWLLIDFDRPNIKLLEDFDWPGLIGMALFLGALQYVLQEGPRNDWFEAAQIIQGITISLIGACLFFWRAFTAANPIVDLSAFRDRNFWTGASCGFVIGIGLHGLTYLYPIYLAMVRDFSPLTIGLTMVVTGASQLCMAPIASRLVKVFDLRLMLGVALALFALGTWLASHVTNDWGFYELLLPQILRGCSIMLAMSAVNIIALGSLPAERIKNASALYTLLRNLGGAVGLALINTGLNKRLDLHLMRLNESVTWGKIQVEEALARFADAFSTLGPHAPRAALRELALLLRQEALVLAFADVFLALSLLFLSMLALLLLMRRTRSA